MGWSWSRVVAHLFGIFIGGAVLWLAGGYFLGIMEGLIFGFVSMVIAAIIIGLGEDRIVTTIKANQGIWQSLRNGIFFASIGVLGIGLFAFLTDVPIFNAAVIGLIFGLFQGFPGCLQHFILRLILYSNNYIPWNYARFLDYAADRIFLQKVGGGYIFIHRMLMEHFAQMEMKQLKIKTYLKQ
ncbi:MAG: hypothetical protein WBG70_22055 [Spirulinaceae cyanobacterium]